jgi:phosphoglycerol geranylgeranyltransferase
VKPQVEIEDFFLGLSRSWALLIDPDKIEPESLRIRLNSAARNGAACILVGGSHLEENQLTQCLKACKDQVSLPCFLFPGPGMPVSSLADGLLFLSLVSGRNADLLIGQHVIAAPRIKAMSIPVISTAYMLVEGDSLTTAHYMSQSLPLPRNKPGLAAATALAASYLGMKLIYLDGGSGAQSPVPEATVTAVKSETGLPIIVGGGVRSFAQLSALWDAGANLVVLGTVAEESPEFFANQVLDRASL